MEAKQTDPRRLIIEIPYGGLGDHLFHSHLPKIAKESGRFDKVFISNNSLFRHPDNKILVWDLNPYVDGFTNEEGESCDLKALVSKVNSNTVTNLLDEVMLAYGLDNGKRWNDPEIYYQPKYIDAYHKVVYDPNFLSWIGNVTAEEAMTFFKSNNFNFEAIMKIRTDKKIYIEQGNEHFIETPTLMDFCDLIHSSKSLFCLTSGTATIASGLGKSATVFYGEGQSEGFRHSKLHKYIQIENSRTNKLKRKLKKLIKK